MWNWREKEEVHTGFWWRNLRGRDRFEYLSEDGRKILKQIFKKKIRFWPGLIRLKTGADGLLLLTS